MGDRQSSLSCTYEQFHVNLVDHSIRPCHVICGTFTFVTLVREADVQFSGQPVSYLAMT